METLYQAPCILVGGAPRSGTTALGNLIGSHPDAAILLEDSLTPIVRHVQQLASLRVAAEDEERGRLFGFGASFVGASFESVREGLQTLSQVAGYRLRFAALLQRLFELSCDRRGPAVIGAKSTIVHRWEDLDHLSQVFSDLRAVFILRNPIDVVASSMRRSVNAARGLDVWHVHSVEDAVCEWLAAMRIMRRALDRLGGKALALKYEDLCDTPAVSAQVFAFCGLSTPAASYGFGRSAPPDRAILGPDGLRHIEDELGEIDDLWAGTKAEDLLMRFSELRPVYDLGREIRLGAPPRPLLLAEGFSMQEPWGCWTDGPSARLSLHVDNRGRGVQLELRCHLAWAAPGRSGAPVQVTVNGRPFGTVEFRSGELIAITVPAEAIGDAGALDVDLRILSPKPHDAPPTGDVRALGVCLEGFRASLLEQPRRRRSRLLRFGAPGARPSPDVG